MTLKRVMRSGMVYQRQRNIHSIVWLLEQKCQNLAVWTPTMEPRTSLVSVAKCILMICVVTMILQILYPAKCVVSVVVEVKGIPVTLHGVGRRGARNLVGTMTHGVPKIPALDFSNGKQIVVSQSALITRDHKQETASATLKVSVLILVVTHHGVVHRLIPIGKPLTPVALITSLHHGVVVSRARTT